MKRLALGLLAVGFSAASVAAQPTTSPSQVPESSAAPASPATPAAPPATPAQTATPAQKPATPPAAPTAPASSSGMPKTGDAVALTHYSDAKMQWMYNAPSANDAAGRVVIHWFCTPKVAACVDDLARIVTLREAGGVYIVAYINGSQRDAKKIDPIRESEGVGRGTLATGPSVKKLFKQLGIAKGPASIVVDLEGKVKAVTTSGDINELDSRDTIIKGLVDSVKPFTTSNQAPKTAKAGEKLAFTFTVQLASWLTFSQKSPMEFTFSAAKEVKCDATKLTRDKLKIADKTLTATVTCTAPRGSYQVRGEIRFGYDSPNGATGLGNDGATWKFDITP
jgi:hypothetical protein